MEQQQQQNMAYPNFENQADTQSYTVPQQDIPQTQAEMNQTVQPPYQPPEQIIPPTQQQQYPPPQTTPAQPQCNLQWNNPFNPPCNHL